MSYTADVKLFMVAFGAYLLALAIFLLRNALKRRLLAWMGVGALALGAFVQLVALGVRWYLAGHVPLSSMHEYASVMSFMAAASLAVLLVRTRRFELGALITPLVIAIMAIASLLPKEIHKQLIPALQSYWLHIHVSMAALGEGAFAVSCGVAIMYLVKAGKPNADPADLARLDSLNHRAISVGYPLFTLGALFAGAIWAYKAWGSFWSWDPKEVSSWIIWLFYTGYLHARFQRGWRGKKAAVLSIVGFVMVILSFLGNLFLGGLHSYG